MNCKNCGAIIKEKDRFCAGCGTKIEKNENIEEKETIFSNQSNKNTNATYQQNNQNLQNISEYNQYNNNNTKTDNETACLICGILSFFTCWIGIILGIVAIVLGVKEKKLTGKTPAGMVCGIISVSIYTLFILIWLAIVCISVALGV